MQKSFPYFLLTLVSAAPLAAQDAPAVRFKGAQAFYEFGSIVKGVELALDTLDNMWVQRFGGTFDLEASRGEHLDLYLGAGSIFWHSIPAISTQTPSKVFYGDAILTKSFAQFTFGENESPWLTGKLGFFPVKYSHSRNLGEYLFRTGTYPNFLVTGNGYTSVSTSNVAVLGTQWTYIQPMGLSHDLFFTSERQSYPLHDFSLTWMSRYKGGFFSAGLGLQLDRIIPVTPSLTTPTQAKNTYFTHSDGQTYVNNKEYYELSAKGATNDSNVAEAARFTAAIALLDSLQPIWDSLPATRPAFKEYTFKGIKPLATLTLDFKALFGDGLFRGDEMVLYSEAVLMGWANQPIYYEDRMKRLALMAGFNVPTFGLLDAFNVELEHWAGDYVNGYRTAREGLLPLPDYNYNVFSGYSPEHWKGDDLKWSVFLSRQLLDGFHLQAQVANDHLRGRRFTRVVSENTLLIDSDNWYYFIKLQASL